MKHEEKLKKLKELIATMKATHLAIEKFEDETGVELCSEFQECHIHTSKEFVEKLDGASVEEPWSKENRYKISARVDGMEVFLITNTKPVI